MNERIKEILENKEIKEKYKDIQKLYYEFIRVGFMRLGFDNDKSKRKVLIK